MKHLKTFESLKYEFKTGDYVVLISESEYSESFGYKIGDLCIVVSVDETDNTYYPYEIEIADNSNEDWYPLWVYFNQIRKATDAEIDQNKYNL